MEGISEHHRLGIYGEKVMSSISSWKLSSRVRDESASEGAFCFCFLSVGGTSKSSRATMTIRAAAASLLSLIITLVLIDQASSFQSSLLHKKGICLTFSMAPSVKQSTARGMTNANEQASSKPTLIIFDLDGCLWSPEMYELLWQGRGAGSPFRAIGDNKMQSNSGTAVELLGDVANVLEELHSDYPSVKVGISSRTDEPSWAMELLQKFQLPNSRKPLQTVFTGPIEISYDSKTQHFERISKSTGVPMTEMLFFDNEFGNCRSVSKQGVSVCHCPNGVTREAFDAAMSSFPCQWGKVING